MSSKPPASVARIARNALERRKKLPPSRRGGTAVGVKRASQLAAQQPVSEETLKRMNSFFARHEKSPGSAKNRRASRSTKASQAWALWGGSAGRAWAKRELRKIERAKKRK